MSKQVDARCQWNVLSKYMLDANGTSSRCQLIVGLDLQRFPLLLVLMIDPLFFSSFFFCRKVHVVTFDIPLSLSLSPYIFPVVARAAAAAEALAALAALGSSPSSSSRCGRRLWVCKCVSSKFTRCPHVGARRLSSKGHRTILPALL